MSGSLRDHIQAVYDKHGQLTPSLVVNEARPKDHPLHSRFEWNNRVAGDAYRRHQAHELIQSVHVRYRAPNGRTETIRAFHAVPAQGGGAGRFVYEPAAKVAAHPLLSQIVLRDMEREWQQLKARYERFEEFWRMVRGDAGEAA